MNLPKDPGPGGHSFVGATLVVCPRCSGCAVSRPRGGGIPDASTPRRVSCTACPLSGERLEPAPPRDDDDARDPFFRLPLWLQTPCCGTVLWALNADHLAFLEGSVGTEDDRLPRWMKSEDNREALLQGLGRLRGRLRQVRSLEAEGR